MNQPDEDKTEKGVEEKADGSADDNENSGKPKTPISVIIAGVILTLIVIVCLQVDDWSRDLTTNFAETSDDASDVDLRPIESQLPPDELADQVVKRMRGLDRWTVGSPEKQDDGSYLIELVHKTLVFQFKDDVKVTIIPTNDGSKMTATSQSRVGKGDLGQNPRNLKELISRVRSGLSES